MLESHIQEQDASISCLRNQVANHNVEMERLKLQEKSQRQDEINCLRRQHQTEMNNCDQEFVRTKQMLDIESDYKL